jgi:glycosyltransferase involved in cell wall biosynthesis
MSTRLSVLVAGINYTPESTGIAPYTAGLASGLVRRGHRVRVLTAHPHYPEWAFREDRPARHSKERIAGVTIDRFLHRVARRAGGVARAVSELSFGVASSASRWGRPDVVVFVSPALFAVAVGLLRLRLTRRMKAVVWVQDLYSLGLRELGSDGGGLLARLVAQLEGLVLRNADHVVVIHERFRETVIEQLGVGRDAVSVVRNWSHVEDLSPVDRVSARAALGWAPEDVIVLHAGNMGVKQGLENVIEAARIAQERQSKAKFVLLGDGNQRQALAEASRDLDRIVIIDPLPDEQFREALGAADVLLVNERSGVSGMAVPSKITSYFSTGRPVIAATDPGSVTESEIETSGGGLVVAAGDPDALLAAVEELAADPDRAEIMGARGRSFRAAVLSENGAIDRYARLLERLGGKGPAPESTGPDSQ